MVPGAQGGERAIHISRCIRDRSCYESLVAVGRKAEGAGVSCTWLGSALPLRSGIFHPFCPFPTRNGVACPGNQIPFLLWGPRPHWTTLPLREPPSLCAFPHFLLIRLSPPPFLACCEAAQAWQTAGARELN